MAREEQTKKSPQELADRAWELAEDIEFCMFVTWDGEKQRARPLDAHVDQKMGAVYFLTDVDSAKVDQTEEFPVVTLTFADNRSMKYVTMSGKAAVSNDRAKIKELFEPSSKAWWDSADDPAIRLITFWPEEAELWDSPGMIVSAVKMLTAAVTGAKPKIGENAKIAI
ncbi:MAG: pyridoxamine 5'-phosphate oxidase family protein [Rhizobiaceae bacterium]